MPINMDDGTAITEILDDMGLPFILEKRLP
jgi:hypothetical protein